MKLSDLHDQVLRYPFPVYDSAMKSVFQELADFKRYLRWHGNMYHVYLWALVKILRPRKILELGTGIGTGTFFMMCALPPGSTLVTVELNPTPPKNLGFWDADLRLTKVVGNDLDLGIYGNLALDGVDFIFIDSDHQESHVDKEWDLYKPFLTPNAVAAFDDIHLSPGITRFWNNLAGEKFDTGNAIHQSGFGLWGSP